MKVKKLKENLIVEAFSPSMPDWLKKSFIVDLSRDAGEYLSGKYRHANNAAFDTNNADRYMRSVRKSAQKRDANVTVPSFYGRNIKHRSLAAALSEYGVDLSKAKFISGPVPKKSTDPRLTRPNVGFLLIQDDQGKTQVYSPGLNDQQASIITNKDGHFDTLKYIPKPKILENSIDFCYVNLDDKDNLITDKVTSRNDPANQEDNAFKRGKPKYRTWSGTTDASGYMVDPEKYKKKLMELGMSGEKIQKKLTSYANELKSLHRDAVNAFQDFDIIGDRDSISTQQEILVTIKDAVSYYNNLVSNAGEIANRYPQGNANAEDYYVRSFMRYDNELKKRLKSIDSLISKYIMQEVDWDTPE